MGPRAQGRGWPAPPSPLCCCVLSLDSLGLESLSLCARKQEAPQEEEILLGIPIKKPFEGLNLG